MKRFLFFLVLVVFIAPTVTFALSVLPAPFNKMSSIPFGGLSVVVIPCTCSSGIWVQFTPFFLGGMSLPVGALTYRPPPTGKSTPYAYYTAGLPKTWHLGEFKPNLPGALTCWIAIGVTCIPLPDLGVINKVGSGIPQLGF